MPKVIFSTQKAAQKSKLKYLIKKSYIEHTSTLLIREQLFMHKHIHIHPFML